MKGWLTGKPKTQQNDKPQTQSYSSSYLNPVKAIAALTKSGQQKAPEKDQKLQVETSPTKEVRPNTIMEPDESSDEENNRKSLASDLSGESIESSNSSLGNPNVNTTAGGDGLSFTVGQPCVFELIYRIKHDKPLFNSNDKS